MKPPSPIELMQFADGELSPERARELSAWIRQSTGRGSARQADGIWQVGDFVRAQSEGASASFDVVDDVMARLEEAPARALRVAPPPAPKRVIAWLPFAAAGLAAAAAVALVFEHSDTPPVGSHVIAARSIPVESASSVVPDAPELEELGASIERLDPGSHGASLFVVQAGAVTTPVVWLLDDGDESGDRMGPL